MDDFTEWVRTQTQVRAAERFGVTQKAVSKWLHNGIPLGRVRQIEEETGIPAWKLRPDTFKRERRAS